MEDKFFRIVDANINRAAEGLRVLEDYARFCNNDGDMSERLKRLRHAVRDNIMSFLPECLKERDSTADTGFGISMETRLDARASPFELAAANFKRVQEAMRALEEFLKIMGKYELAKTYEKCRFDSYSLEKEFCAAAGFEGEGKKAKMKLFDPGIYCITAEKYSGGRSNIDVVKAMIGAGVRIIQYREKEKSMLEKYRECIKIREMTGETGVLLIVNDHADLALAAGADGVHIGQDDLPLEKVRELTGDGMIIGVSTHSPEQARAAVRGGADYIGIGPIYRTFTKKDVCEPVGLECLDYAVKNVPVPFVAIGGIKEHNLHEVLERGARCVAMVTEIVGAEDIAAKILSIRKKMGRIVSNDLYNADGCGKEGNNYGANGDGGRQGGENA